MAGEAQKSLHKYVPGHEKSHITLHAMRTAENSAAYLLPTLQAMVKSQPHLKLLDCGAGPGTISVSLAKYLPEGEVLATDFSADVIKRAASYAEEQGATNVKCEVASIYDLPYPDGSFDVVHVHQFEGSSALLVLTHLDEPLKAMRSLLRVCRVGGVVAVREIDMRMFSYHPETPDLVAAHRLLIETMKAGGGSIDLGPRLVSIAMQAGVQRSQIQASMGTLCYSTPEERLACGSQFRDRLKTGSMRETVLEAKLASEQELETLMKAWEEWTTAEDGVLGMMSGEILVTKQ